MSNHQGDILGRQPDQNGFTLIEMLVVIARSSQFLSGYYFPRCRRRAKRPTCSTQSITNNYLTGLKHVETERSQVKVLLTVTENQVSQKGYLAWIASSIRDQEVENATLSRFTAAANFG